MERSALPIQEKDLAAYSDRVNALLRKVSYTPRASVEPGSKTKPGELSWMSAPALTAQQEEVSIFKIAHSLNPESPLLLQDKVNHAVTTVWQGLRISAYLQKLYEKTSNLEVLVEQNRRGVLESAQKTEFRDKCTTASAIAVFVAAYYIFWELSRSDGNESRAEINGIPEINLQTPVDAVNCVLYYYTAYLQQTGLVQNAGDFVRVTRLYFEALVNEIKSREGSLKYTEPFVSRTYKLQGSEFAVNGFSAEAGAALVSVEFNRVELDEIVGNRTAKRQARLLAQRLLCHDFEQNKNPMMELGGMPRLRMGYGPPGTGKSMLIAAIATMLSDWCKLLKYPFAFRPLPDNIISTFQGGSAERGVEWFRLFHDTTKIQYGPIDDGEIVLEDRTRENVSAGVREFIGVFLRMTEGAYAINPGNYTIDVFTNLPDQIDKAVLSRIVHRFMIAGAENRTDFTDQDYLWWKRYLNVDTKFVNMQDSSVHKYMEAQRLLRSLSEAQEHYDEPKDERVRAIYRRVRERQDPSSHLFFGRLFVPVRLPVLLHPQLQQLQGSLSRRMSLIQRRRSTTSSGERNEHQGTRARRSILVPPQCRRKCRQLHVATLAGHQHDFSGNHRHVVSVACGDPPVRDDGAQEELSAGARPYPALGVVVGETPAPARQGAGVPFLRGWSWSPLSVGRPST